MKAVCPEALTRLSRRHRLVGGLTRRLSEEAGPGGCCRALDVGSGASLRLESPEGHRTH